MNYSLLGRSRMLTMTLCLLLCGVVQIFARPLREQEARLLAEQFFQKNTQMQQLRSAELTLVSAPACTSNGYELKSTDEPARYYYVYNRGEGRGFVIISGDDRLAPYIGYATTGSFSAEAMPDNLAAFLEACQQRIDELMGQVAWQTRLTPTLPKAGEPAEVAPLLGDIEWDQSAPWNSKTPVDGKGKHMPVGCVATAYAQVMRYYQWPDKGEGKVEYKEPYKTRKHKVNFGKTTYDWANMPASYEDPTKATAEETEALGLLCYHAGVAIETDYDPVASGSFAPLIVRALRNNFRYNKQVTFKRRVNYTQPEWDRIIRTELAAQRPVVYSGTGSGGGHAFVCDGYNDEGLYHINWGWSGLANGYFNLNFLQPDDLGIGGGFGGGFSMEQGIVVGITPDRDGTSKDTELPLVTTRKFTTHLMGGPKIRILDANYSVWLSDVPTLDDEGKADYEYFGFTTIAAAKLGTTDTVYMDDYKKSKYLVGLYDLVPEFQADLDVTKYLSEGTWDIFIVYEVTLPDGTKEWRPCAMDVREGYNENGKGRHTFTIEKDALGWKVHEDLTHPFAQLEMVEGSAHSTFKAYEKSTVSLKLKNTGRGEFFRPLYLEIKSEGGEWRAYSDILPAIQVGETQEVTFNAERCPYAKGTISLRVSYQTEDMGKMQYFELPNVTVEASDAIRTAYVIEPASKTEPMEVDLGTGEFSQIRVKNVGTIAPDHEVKCRYILKYGIEQVWTDLVTISIAPQGEQILTPKLPELVKRLGVIGGNKIQLTMSFFEMGDDRKHRLPILEEPIIEVTCKKGTSVQKDYPVTKQVEGEGELIIKGYEDLTAVPDGTTLTVEAKPAAGYELTALEANGKDILAAKSFTVSAATTVKGVFTKVRVFTVKLTSNEHGSISVKEDVDLNAVPYGTKLTVETRGNNDECELKSLTANGKDIMDTKSFTVIANTEVKAEFVDHTSVEGVVAEQLRLYPNPARDYVLLEGIPAGATVAIYTLEGQLIYQAEAASDTLRIDLTQLQEGAYILRVGGEMHRLIVRR